MLIWQEIELVFRPTLKEGLFLYNGNRYDGQGYFMPIFWNQGFAPSLAPACIEDEAGLRLRVTSFDIEIC